MLSSEQKYTTFSFADEFQGKKNIREIFTLTISTFTHYQFLGVGVRHKMLAESESESGFGVKKVASAGL